MRVLLEYFIWLAVFVIVGLPVVWFLLFLARAAVYVLGGAL